MQVQPSLAASRHLHPLPPNPDAPPQHWDAGDVYSPDHVAQPFETEIRSELPKLLDRGPGALDHNSIVSLHVKKGPPMLNPEHERYHVSGTHYMSSYPYSPQAVVDDLMSGNRHTLMTNFDAKYNARRDELTDVVEREG